MLDDRKSAILRAVVQTYIETAQPVGSGHVVEAAAIGVSPATVRSEMTVLEREGYLAQPHTSAGRIPTEKGYRFFVDEIGPGHLDPSQARTVSGFFSHVHGELEVMLQSTSRLLSRLTSTTAMVVGEVAETRTVRSVQLIGLSERSYLALTVLSSGTVLKHTVERDTPVSEDDLAAVGSLLTNVLRDHLVSDLDRLVIPDGVDGAQHRRALVVEAIAAIRQAAEATGRTLHIEGASNIAGAFDASETMQEVLSLLEQQMSVVTLIRDVLDRGLTVAIGSETGLAPLAECSLVVAPYRVGGENAGAIGVLGPTRMNYQETLAAVAVVSNRLSRLLTEGE
ncbi:MAG: heat-inducible transcription repressor HrcA [Actinobacteria bacterium]|nr:heat-inducible transcription repressor HrcA [Actinomycetota bacterium]